MEATIRCRHCHESRHCHVRELQPELPPATSRASRQKQPEAVAVALTAAEGKGIEDEPVDDKEFLA